MADPRAQLSAVLRTAGVSPDLEAAVLTELESWDDDTHAVDAKRLTRLLGAAAQSATQATLGGLLRQLATGLGAEKRANAAALRERLETLLRTIGTAPLPASEAYRCPRCASTNVRRERHRGSGALPSIVTFDCAACALSDEAPEAQSSELEARWAMTSG